MSNGRNNLWCQQRWTDCGCVSVNLCEPFAQLSIAYCGSKKSIYIHVCVRGTCVVEHFVGDLCSRFKPLSTLHLSVLLSLSLSLSPFSLALTPSFSLSGGIDPHLPASEAPVPHVGCRCCVGQSWDVCDQFLLC